MGRPSYPVLPWTNTGKTSGLYKCDGNQIVGFAVPATFVSTTVKFNMTTNLNANPVVWMPVSDSSGSQISFTTTTLTAAYCGFSQDQIAKFEGCEAIQMTTSSNESANIAIQLAVIPRRY